MKVPTFDLTVRVRTDPDAIRSHNDEVERGFATGNIDLDPSEWDADELAIAMEEGLASFDIVGGETGPDEEVGA